MVPGSAVGLIIGKGGETIRRLEMESRCRIQVAPRTGRLHSSAPSLPAPTGTDLFPRLLARYFSPHPAVAGATDGPDAERRVTISGPKADIDRARQLVDEVIGRRAGGQPGRSSGPALSGANAIGGKSVRSGAPWRPEPSDRKADPGRKGAGACVRSTRTRRSTTCRRTVQARSSARAVPQYVDCCMRTPPPSPPHPLFFSPGRPPARPPRFSKLTRSFHRRRSEIWSAGQARSCTSRQRTRPAHAAPSPLWATKLRGRAPRSSSTS